MKKQKYREGRSFVVKNEKKQLIQTPFYCTTESNSFSKKFSG